MLTDYSGTAEGEYGIPSEELTLESLKPGDWNKSKFTTLEYTYNEGEKVLSKVETYYDYVSPASLDHSDYSWEWQIVFNYTYDDTGKLVGDEYQGKFDGDGSDGYSVYTYNAAGRVATIENHHEYWGWGEHATWYLLTENLYDGDNKLTESNTSYYRDSILVRTETHDYDETENLVSTIISEYETSTLVETETSTFDEKGRLILQVNRNANDAVTQQLEYTYDAHDNRTLYRSYWLDSTTNALTVGNEIVDTYDYDENGNVLLHQTIKPGNEITYPDNKIEEQYSYDEFGNVLRSEKWEVEGRYLPMHITTLYGYACWLQ